MIQLSICGAVIVEVLVAYEITVLAGNSQQIQSVCWFPLKVIDKCLAGFQDVYPGGEHCRDGFLVMVQ